jgi:hypothetical protein
MMAGLTSPARPWFRLITPDPDFMEFAPVRRWLYICELRLREVFSKSNFYNVLFTTYQDLGVIGTHAMTMLEDLKDTLRCYPYTPGRYAIATDDRGVVDTVYREVPMQVRQAVMAFGIENVSTRTKNLYNGKGKDQWIDILHSIQPNMDAEYGKADNRNLPYYSCYFEADQPDDTKFLKEGGFYEFPGLCPRWDLAESEDIYGSSPAMDALGDARALQLQQKRKAQAIDKHVDPPMVAHPDLKHQRTSLLPGDVTYAAFSNTGGAPGFQPAYLIKPEITALREDIGEIQDRIRRAMYEDLFLMLTLSDRREITAEEIRERHEEKLLMLGPVLERLNDELLDPAIDRAFAICLRAGLIPEAPPEIQGVDLRVEYISVLAQAQRLVATQGLERLTTYVGVVAKAQADSQQPISIMDKIDFDEAIDEYGYALGVPPKIIRSKEEVEALRAERAQQQQAEMAAAAAKPVSDYAKAAQTLSETQVNGTNALEAVVGAQ